MSELRRRHRQGRSGRRLARIVRIVAIAICLAAIGDFVFDAYGTSNCFTNDADPFASAHSPLVAVDSEECRALIAHRDVFMRIDAMAVLLAIALFIGASVVLSHARRSTKRMVLGTEAVVVVLVLAYSMLWIYSAR